MSIVSFCMYFQNARIAISWVVRCTSLLLRVVRGCRRDVILPRDVTLSMRVSAPYSCCSWLLSWRHTSSLRPLTTASASRNVSANTRYARSVRAVKMPSAWCAHSCEPPASRGACARRIKRGRTTRNSPVGTVRGSGTNISTWTIWTKWTTTSGRLAANIE